VSHEGILASLRQGLQVDSAGHFLQIGSVRVPVEVEDAPFVVVRFETEGEGWALWLSDGSREVPRPREPRAAARGRALLPVKDGRFEARFSRAAAWQLLQRLDTPPGGTPTLAARRTALPAGRLTADLLRVDRISS